MNFSCLNGLMINGSEFLAIPSSRCRRHDSARLPDWLRRIDRRAAEPPLALRLLWRFRRAPLRSVALLERRGARTACRGTGDGRGAGVYADVVGRAARSSSSRSDSHPIGPASAPRLAEVKPGRPSSRRVRRPGTAAPVCPLSYGAAALSGGCAGTASRLRRASSDLPFRQGRVTILGIQCSPVRSIRGSRFCPVVMIPSSAQRPGPLSAPVTIRRTSRHRPSPGYPRGTGVTPAGMARRAASAKLREGAGDRNGDTRPRRPHASLPRTAGCAR